MNGIATFAIGTAAALAIGGGGYLAFAVVSPAATAPLSLEDPMAKWLGAPSPTKERLVEENFRYRLAITNGDLSKDQGAAVVACMDGAFASHRYSAEDFEVRPISDFVQGCVVQVRFAGICSGSNRNAILCGPDPAAKPQ
jgi:hypothetical protein